VTGIAATATIEPGATIGARTVVWDLTQVRANARVGADCTIGRNVFIDTGVVVGDRCKIQNNALLYAPARLAEGVFIGPSVVLTNDRFPRAVDASAAVKSAQDWQAAGVEIGAGASLGAGSIVVAGVRIASWAMVAAGAVVTRDVVSYALMAGVPARRIGWVGRAGQPLTLDDSGVLRCPVTGDGYAEFEGDLREVR
jgi:UDP-2-acetamido-3-amino-2,3-dideoxy-glucuronate N-acetyltransferase